MTLRFQADADFNLKIVAAAVRREPSIDFRTADEARLRGLTDLEVLARAAAESRVLVTHDRKTMPRHFAEFLSRSSSPGLLIFPQYLPIGTVVEELVLIWSATEAAEWTNRLYIFGPLTRPPLT